LGGCSCEKTTVIKNWAGNRGLVRFIEEEETGEGMKEARTPTEEEAHTRMN
jgi:hypothetical protein